MFVINCFAPKRIRSASYYYKSWKRCQLFVTLQVKFMKMYPFGWIEYGNACNEIFTLINLLVSLEKIYRQLTRYGDSSFEVSIIIIYQYRPAWDKQQQQQQHRSHMFVADINRLVPVVTTPHKNTHIKTMQSSKCNERKWIVDLLSSYYLFNRWKLLRQQQIEGKRLFNLIYRFQMFEYCAKMANCDKHPKPINNVESWTLQIAICYLIAVMNQFKS